LVTVDEKYTAAKTEDREEGQKAQKNKTAARGVFRDEHSKLGI
jgi:hypothetical protein